MTKKGIGSLTYETPRQGGYKNVTFIGHGGYVLTDENDKKELWQGHEFPNYSGYGIKYKDIILEFVKSL